MVSGVGSAFGTAGIPLRSMAGPGAGTHGSPRAHRVGRRRWAGPGAMVGPRRKARPLLLAVLTVRFSILGAPTISGRVRRSRSSSVTRSWPPAWLMCPTPGAPRRVPGWRSPRRASVRRLPGSPLFRCRRTARAFARFRGRRTRRGSTRVRSSGYPALRQSGQASSSSGPIRSGHPPCAGTSTGGWPSTTPASAWSAPMSIPASPNGHRWADGQ